MNKSVCDYLASIGSKGGTSAAKSMTAAQRKARGKRAIAARWKKRDAKATEVASGKAPCLPK